MEEIRGTRQAPAFDDGLDLRVSVERHDGARGPAQVLTIAGDLDVVGASRLRRHLPEAVGHLLVADLVEVEFLDSSGVGALIALHRQCAASGGALALCRLQPQPRMVLSLTAADTLLAVHTTLAEALGVAGTAPGPTADRLTG